MVGFEDGKVVLGGSAAELVFPNAHLIAVPASHAAFVDAERGVGHDEGLVDADHLAEAFARGAGSEWRVEGEEILGGFFEGETVGLEAGREFVGDV